MCQTTLLVHKESVFEGINDEIERMTEKKTQRLLVQRLNLSYWTLDFFERDKYIYIRKLN